MSLRLWFFSVLLAVWLGEVDLIHAADRLVLATAGPADAAQGVPSRTDVEAAVLQRLADRAFAVSLLAWSDEALDPSLWLGARADEKEAALAIGIRAPNSRDDAARIWVVDRVTGKTVRRDLRGDASGHEADRIALAVEELVDASLSELDLGHRTLQPDAQPSPGLRKRSRDGGVHQDATKTDAMRPVSPPQWDEPEAQQAARRENPVVRRRFGVGAEAGVVWPVREQSVAPIARVALAYLPNRHAWVGPEVTLPLTQYRTREAGAQVSSLLFMFGVAGAYDVMQERHPAHLDVLGGVHVVAVDARLRSPSISTRKTHWTGTVDLGMRVRVEIGRYVDLGLTARLDVPFVQRRLRSEGTVVQDLSAVWLSGTGGLRVRW